MTAPLPDLATLTRIGQGRTAEVSMFDRARSAEDELAHVQAALLLCGLDASSLDDAIEQIAESWQQRANSGGSLGES